MTPSAVSHPSSVSSLASRNQRQLCGREPFGKELSEKKAFGRPLLSAQPFSGMDARKTNNPQYASEENLDYDNSNYEISDYDNSSFEECLNEIEREELEFLAQFIQGTAFYAESLEEYIGEPLEDFWQAREHAYHIVTTYLILNIGEGG